MSASILNAQNLSKVVGSAEGKLTILHDLSLDLARGDSLAIVGSSGSGKSTLLGLLAAGELARIVAQALAEADSLKQFSGALASVGAAFQFQGQHHVLQRIEAVEQLERLEHEAYMGRADARQRARELLERVGLGQRLGHYPRQLSGGEQQRVAIARAFAAQPDVLFADEPTGNLDSATGERISDLLFELNRERGTTLVLVTHDERLAHRCRRLIRLESGRLIDRVEP
ncbi:ATP-binding cassette domain-containing protein [Pseudomonas aeruginosa]|uniref:ABC transporter ATP-binding protein n=1 Tax=Pseudomonas aeruginosa TaxID=287 RepID=UPI0027D3AE49|nr:ATP-binding cassette domain-containing protein [Pseudomonas aeruginosa]MDQ4392276.1 ATP-binding cassette domain-containing protein [Pseudomonas aeruginosa]